MVSSRYILIITKMLQGYPSYVRSFHPLHADQLLHQLLADDACVPAHLLTGDDDLSS
jgi:hypothetical protein